MKKPNTYSIYGDFLVTENKKERTYTIYDSSKRFICTVDDGELKSELDALEAERS